MSELNAIDYTPLTADQITAWIQTAKHPLFSAQDFCNYLRHIVRIKFGTRFEIKTRYQVAREINLILRNQPDANNPTWERIAEKTISLKSKSKFANTKDDFSAHIAKGDTLLIDGYTGYLTVDSVLPPCSQPNSKTPGTFINIPGKISFKENYTGPINDAAGVSKKTGCAHPELTLLNVQLQEAKKAAGSNAQKAGADFEDHPCIDATILSCIVPRLEALVAHQDQEPLPLQFLRAEVFIRTPAGEPRLFEMDRAVSRMRATGDRFDVLEIVEVKTTPEKIFASHEKHSLSLSLLTQEGCEVRPAKPTRDGEMTMDLNSFQPTPPLFFITQKTDIFDVPPEFSEQVAHMLSTNHSFLDFGAFERDDALDQADSDRLFEHYRAIWMYSKLSGLLQSYHDVGSLAVLQKTKQPNSSASEEGPELDKSNL